MQFTPGRPAPRRGASWTSVRACARAAQPEQTPSMVRGDDRRAPVPVFVTCDCIESCTDTCQRVHYHGLQMVCAFSRTVERSAPGNHGGSRRHRGFSLPRGALPPHAELHDAHTKAPCAQARLARCRRSGDDGAVRAGCHFKCGVRNPDASNRESDLRRFRLQPVVLDRHRGP